LAIAKNLDEFYLYMDDSAHWQEGNEQYLALALAWLRLRLAWQTERTQGSPPSPQAVTEAEVAQAASVLAAAEETEPPPALVMLSQQFGLSRFEQHVLLLCVAMELDTRIATLCAHAQDNPHQSYPTFALALTSFDEPAWDVLSPQRPLRYWRLIEINQSGAQPLTISPLRADERIVNYLKGLNYLDDRLMPLLVPLGVADAQVELPPSQQAVVKTIVRRLQQVDVTRRLPVIQLLGPDAASKQLVAWHAATALGLYLYRLPVELLPTRAVELETLARLWQRESLLMPVALYLEAHEVDAETPTGGPVSLLDRFLARSGGLFFLDVRDVQPGLGQATFTFDVAKPTPAEQQEAWTETVGTMSPEGPGLLAGQFNLGLPAIQEITQTVLAEPPEEGRPVYDLLWDACLVRTRPGLDILAQRLTPKATWDDIVLPDNESSLLRQIADQVGQRGTVYEEWGFRQRMSRGLGITALFAGESGTGKTMAAEVMANDLRLNLYRIDLSGVVSKYVGETEKNLRRLFDAAEDGGAILFFDEADALFGKRSQVRDSHDRYANIEINYLLQRMEAYQSLAILATNRKGDLDKAFTRRLRFIVNFPVPGPPDRKRIWQKIFPPETPTAELDFDRLASFNLTGGSIHNTALNAAFLAAQAGTPVTMPLVLNAIRTEFLKTDRLINEASFRWEGSG
jgi:hypothetical protein